MLVPKVIRQKVMGSQVRTWKWKARNSKVKYQWWRRVDRSKIINMARNSQGKDEKLRSRRSFRSKIMVSKVVVSKVTGRRSVGWKVSGVEGRSGERSWCHKSWCPTSSVKDAGAKGYQAKVHEVTGHNLEIKGQEVKGEILVMKRRGSVQNNKHGWKIIGQKWKVKEWKVGQVKDYGVIIVVVSKVTGRRSVGWKVSGVEYRSGERSWCHRSWCPTSSVKDAGAKRSLGKRSWGHRSEVGNQRPGSQRWNISDEEVWIAPKYINMPQKSQVKTERLRSRRSLRSKIMV